MSTDKASWRRLNEENRDVWDANASHWDQRMADGNDFQRELVGPATERLLELRPGERVLDVACGNGVMSRRLADLGASVVACDFAPSMVELAQRRSEARKDGIEFHLVDAANRDQLLALGLGWFDAVICNQAIMDMAEIDPLMEAVPRLLKPTGRFVFTLLHPCFNNSACIRTTEETDRGGEVRVEHSIRIAQYQTLGAEMGVAMRGQLRPQYYFHRTLAVLLGCVFAHGMAVDGLEEPSFVDPKEGRPTSSLLFSEIPPVLSVRARPRGPTT